MRRLIVLAVVVSVFSGLFTGSAQAAAPSPYTMLDRVGTENVYRRNDIRSVTIVNGSTIAITVRTREGANPASHPAWRNRQTLLGLKLITTPGPYDDYRLALQGRPNGPPALTLIEPSGAVTCAGLTFEFVGSDRYRFVIPRSCVEDPATIRLKVQYFFDPPVGPGRLDEAPNVGYSPRVAFAP